MKTFLTLVFLCALPLELRAAEPALKIPPGLKTNAEFVLRAAEAIAACQDTLDLDFLYDRDGFHGLDKHQGQERWAMLRNPPPELLPERLLDASRLPGERNLVPAIKPESKRVEVVEMRPGPWTVEELRPLLKHKNPKVRTLGIMLMFQLNRCDVLPEIAALAKDHAKTFRSLQLGAGGLGFPGGPKIQPQYVEQRVSDFASAVCNTWCMASPELEKARYDVRTSPPAMLEQFIKRRHPTLNTASLEIALQRMTSGTSPLPEARRNRVNQFYAMLERIEQPRRFFVAVHLQDPSLDFERGAGNYLLRMAREVPRELRLAAVFGERPINDPDMWHFGRYFLRAHAVDLFQTADAERFLQTAAAIDMEYYSRHSEYAANMIAAAELNPRRAGEFLREALKNIQRKPEDRHLGTDERQPVATALAFLDEEQDHSAALDWFFQMEPRRGSYSYERVTFLQQINNRDAGRYRRIVERIVRDPRLPKLGTASTRMLIDAAQGYLGRPLVDAFQFRESARLPESQLDQRFKLLTDWQRALTDTVDEWSLEKPNLKPMP